MKERELVPGPYKIWLQKPKLIDVMVPLGAYYQGHSSLSKAEIEIATNLINARWLAAYSNYEHEWIAEQLGGLPAEKVEALIAGLPTSFEDPQRLELHDAEEKYTLLNERVRQVVILAAGAVWESGYELYAHAAAARRAGLSEEAIRTLVSGGLPDDLDEQEKIAQQYARKLSAEHRVDAALYSAAEQAFGRQGVVDLTYLIGIYHVTCSLLNAFEIPVPGEQI